MQIPLLGLWLLFVWPFCVFAYAPLFDQDEVIEMRLRGDFSSFRRLEDRKGRVPEDVVPVPGTLIYSDGNRTFQRSVTISPRGNNRYYRCPLLPPLMIDFKGGEGDAPLWNGLEKLKVKLTTPCFSTEALISDRPARLKKSSPPTEYILREYAIYQLLEKFGLPAFKTRLVKMTYEDEGGYLFFTAYSFFIEPRKLFERRYHARYLTWKELPREKRRELQRYEQQQGLEIDLQQIIYVEPIDHMYFDHHETTMNNRGFLFSKETGRLISVPCYDFDWSYLVNAPIRAGEPFSTQSVLDRMNLEATWFEGDLYRPGHTVEERKVELEFVQRAYGRKKLVLEAFAKIPLRDRALFKHNLENIFAALKRRLSSI